MVNVHSATRCFHLGAFVALVLVCAAGATHAGTSAKGAEEALAQSIRAATGVTGGLVVHLGCGDGKLAAALHAATGALVHGLDTDADTVRQAQAHIRTLGLYGPVSAERFDGTHLPYADNLVNLLVAPNGWGNVPRAELMRALAPQGVAYVRQGGAWTKTVKPRPGNTDEWTHFLHDASGNAVAHDEVVGPPRRFQWVAGPRHGRSHEHTPSVEAVVSAGGRLFYIVDDAPVMSMRRAARWSLVARDAYNGVVLWKRPVAAWFTHLCGWTQGPRQLQRKLVAVAGKARSQSGADAQTGTAQPGGGDRVYVTLGFHAPLSAVDAATGTTVKVYEGTEGTEEIVCHNGILLLAVRRVTDERVAEFKNWRRLAAQKTSPLHTRDTMKPLFQRFRRTEAKAPRTVLALDADTGRVLWKKSGKDAGLRPMSLCALGDRVFYQRGRNAVCLDLKTGREVWAKPSAPMRVVCRSAVVCAGRQAITALSADTGDVLWTQKPLLHSIKDTFVINGSLWLGGFKPFDTGRKHTGPVWGPYFVTQRDLSTGKVLKHIEPDNPGHHNRCYPSKATSLYILGSRRGAEFIDLKSGECLWHSWVRGVCRYGVMPCNGLLYAPPHACGCYITAKLTGFNALAPAARDEGPGTGGVGTAPTLQRGPAYGKGGARQSSSAKATANRSAGGSEDEWPTLRHDAGRSGCTTAAVPAKLRLAWERAVGGRLTAPTVAGGTVFVASADEHRVCATDARTGEPAWTFTAGGRVDSPPTVCEGRAVFGSRDGHVYSVRTSDGALAWRLRAARSARRIVAYGQLESASPVPGSVLVRDGVVTLTAGRSSYLDGGIALHRIQLASGKVLSTTPIYSSDPDTGKQPAQYGPCAMPGALADVLTADDEHVYLRDLVFDRQGASQPKGNPHLLTLTGFLDGSWPHRSYWIYGTRCSLATGCSGRDRNLVYGRLLVFDTSTVYGYGRAKVHWSNQLEDGAYRVFARARGQKQQRWAKPMPILVRAMVLAGNVLFVAGPPAEARHVAPTPGTSHGALLIALSVADGTELARCPLGAPPVFDGMAAAHGRLYLALENSRLVCMARRGGE